MTNHDFVVTHPPVHGSDRFVLVPAVWECSRCGLKGEVLPKYDSNGSQIFQEVDCDSFVVRRIMDS